MWGWGMRGWARLGVAVAILVAAIGVRPEPTVPDEDPSAAYPVLAESEAERTHASPNFSVTWIHDSNSPEAPSLRDQDGGGIPDSVERLLHSFETARTFLLGELGYRPPPGSGPLRIYVSAVREGLAVTKPAPGGTGVSRPSYIVFPTDLLRPPDSPRSLRLLAVHEYFHAIQNGYDAGYDLWFGEASSTWVQDVFDDPLDSNHRYLRDFVPFPRRSLTDLQGENEYGTFLFVQFLVERYGSGKPQIVREIWEEMAAAGAGGDTFAAIEAVLTGRGTSLARAWAEFQLWRWDLDRFGEGSAYRKAVAGSWPKPLQTTEVVGESCRLSSDQGTGLPALSGDYSVFRPADKPDSAKATLTVEGPPGAIAFALVQLRNGSDKVHVLELDAQGLASAAVRFGDGQVRRVVLGPANAARSSGPASFGYSLRLLGRSGVEVGPTAPPPETHLFGGLNLRGRVLCNGQPQPDVNVILVQDKRSGERRTFPLTTLAGGAWSWTFEPEQTSSYHVEVVDPLLSPASSPSWDVAVRVALQLEVPDPDVALGEAVTVEGEIHPPHPGAVILIEYQRPDLSWRAGPQVSPQSADGSFATSFTLPAAGIWNLRATAVSTGDQDHVGTSTIHDVLVNVR
jgi:hypothetical protein